MAKIINTENSVIGLPSGHVLPRNGEITCTNDTITANWSSLSGPVKAGQIKVEYDPEEEEKPKGRKNG